MPEHKKTIAETARQKRIQISGGNCKYTSDTLNNLIANVTLVKREFYNYYRTIRGKFTPFRSTPELTARSTLSTFTKFVNFYPFSGIKTISPRLILFISGGQGHSLELSKGAYSRAAGPKGMIWALGAGHVDLYDCTELILFRRLTAFFRKGLA